MCRLYGCIANLPTRVDCALVHAQNALLVQSRGDRSGGTHTHGWGIAAYENAHVFVERLAWAAYDGQRFRAAAAAVRARVVLAHVRHATVGAPNLVNTHPFVDGRWALIHNGTVQGFAAIRGDMLAAMARGHREAIRGDTDSEHIFRMILSERDAAPARAIGDILAGTVRRIAALSMDAAPGGDLGLNITLTDGRAIAATRFGRSLFMLRREGSSVCAICGLFHETGPAYRAAELASEPITAEDWRELPDRSILSVTDDVTTRIEHL